MHSVRAIVALNLHNYASGRNPWGNLKPEYLEKVLSILYLLALYKKSFFEHVINLPKQKHSGLSGKFLNLLQKGFVEAQVDDGVLEIFGLKQGWHASLVMVELISAKHIAQVLFYSSFTGIQAYFDFAQ